MFIGKEHELKSLQELLFFSLSGYMEWFNTLKKDDVILLTVNDLYELHL